MKNNTKQEGKSNQNHKEKENKSQKKSRIFLFPGERYNFNRNLLSYNIFSYQPKKNTSQSLVSKKTSIINLAEQSMVYIGKFYTPNIDDVVIGIITQKSFEYYKLNINSSREGYLSSIEFEGATKKTKPNLQVGDIVFSRVIHENKFDNTILSCKDLEGSKNWSSGESRFGVLNGGNLYKINRLHCFKLLTEDDWVIDRLRDFCEFEICIGMNGNIWINAETDDDSEKIYQSILKSFEVNKNKYEIFLNKLFNSK